VVAALAAVPALSACMTGLIYTHTYEPLTTNFDHTPVQLDRADEADGDVKHVRVPLSEVDLDVLWNSNAIGDVAKREGLERVDYADLETLKVLTVWNTYTVHVYGKAKAKQP
jgi:hypothetical protein